MVLLGRVAPAMTAIGSDGGARLAVVSVDGSLLMVALQVVALDGGGAGPRATKGPAPDCGSGGDDRVRVWRARDRHRHLVFEDRVGRRGDLLAPAAKDRVHLGLLAGRPRRGFGVAPADHDIAGSATH